MRPLHDPEGGRRWYPAPGFPRPVEQPTVGLDTALAMYRQHPWRDGRCTACGVATDGCTEGRQARRELRARGYDRPVDEDDEDPQVSS